MSLTSSCELFTRSHAGHISKLTEVFQYLYLLNGEETQNVLVNVMVWKLDKQTILHNGIALELILILSEIEMTIVEVNMVCMWTWHEVLMYSAVIKMDVLPVLSNVV